MLRVRQQTLRKAVTIPSAALERGEDGFFVYIIDAAGTAAVRKVIPGPIESGRAVIEKGLAGTERVVTSGQYRLDVGTPVSIQQAAASQAVTKE